jgi:hypothetical protein
MADASIAGVPVKELFGPYFSKNSVKFGRYAAHSASDSSSDSDTGDKSVRLRRQVTTVVSQSTSSASKPTRRVVTSKSSVEEDLRDNLHFLELQLVNLRDENAKLKQSYHSKLEELSSTLKVRVLCVLHDVRGRSTAAVLSLRCSDCGGEIDSRAYARELVP